MSLKEFKSEIVVTGIICLCAGLFSMAHYMGWLEQDYSLLGNLARNLYGPSVRQGDPLNVSPELFRRHIREFKKAGYTFIDVDDLRQCLAGKASLPEKALLISFDDGYADNYNYAYPILLDEKVSGTFFVVSSTVGNVNRMTADELREMQANGMAIGSHTVNHESLAGMADAEIEFEMRRSREALEKLLGRPVYALAYPEGKVDKAVLDKVGKYYEMAFLASVAPEKKQTLYTLQRYGVFSWNDRIESIFRNR